MQEEKRDLSKRILYFVNYCLTPHEYIENAGILCEGETILAIGGASAFTKEPGLKVIELPNAYAVPGFIDTHIHGAGGFDSSTVTKCFHKFEMMCKVLASHGITSFLPTIVSEKYPKILKTISTLADLLELKYDGAEAVGIHVEGPFINSNKRGAQKEAFIRTIDLGEAREIIEAGRGKIKIMTFAPELDNAVKFVELLCENNIKPSMGHSVANEKQVLAAINAGATRCTHLFNGMPRLHQRKIGLTALALVDNRVDVEIILDGTLIHPRMIELACRTKPNHRIIGISDAVEGMGLSDGTYHLGKSEIQVTNGKVTTADGILAGTIQSLEKGWQHLVEASHMSRNEAAACLSINPAQSIGLEHRGELKPRKYADIAFFDIESHMTILTVSKGKIVYDAKKQ